MRNKVLFLQISVSLLCFHLYGQELTVSKKVFAIPEPAHFFVQPSMDFNSVTKETLAVWEKHPGNHPDHSTLARRISAKGVPKGSPFTIISGTNTYTPSIAYNKFRNEFALIYADEVGNSLMAVYLQILDEKGQKKGGPLQISTDRPSDSLVNDNPRILFDPERRTYTILWLRSETIGGTGPLDGLYGTVLNENLETVAPPVLIRRAQSTREIPSLPIVSDLEIHPNGKLLIGFQEFIDAHSANHFIGALQPDLRNIRNSNFTRVNQSPVSDSALPSMVFAKLPSAFLVIYNENSGVKKRKLNSKANVAGAPLPAFSSPLKKKKLSFIRMIPTLSGSSPAKGMLLAIEDPLQSEGHGNIWIQLVDATGKALGTPVNADSDFTTALQPVGIALPSTPSKLKFSILYVDGRQIALPPGPDEFSQLIHLKLAVSLPSN